MDEEHKHTKFSSNIPQCQYYVMRKKRLCRMTVRPGRQYCGEHEPQPRTEDGKVHRNLSPFIQYFSNLTL